MPTAILVVSESPREQCEPLLRALADDGHDVAFVVGFAEGRRLFQARPPGMLVVDLGPRPAAGLRLCSAVRAHGALSAVPVAVLTAEDTLEDKEKGFAAGADLALPRGLDPKRLCLWVRSLTRRARAAEEGGGVLRADDFVVDPRARTVKAAGRAVKDLTPKEFALLYELVRRRPRVLSKEALLRVVSKGVLRDNTLEVHVLNLRRKLGPDGRRVVTVPKKGYRFV